MKHNKPGASNKPNTAKIILIILSIILALAAFCFAYLLLKEQRNNKDILAAYSEIDNSFGIGPSKITLTSAQGDFSRGGNLEAKGVDDNNNKINIYYHWGWCSSGGADCGLEFCASAPSAESNIHYYTEFNAPEENWLYLLFKENLCNRYDGALKESCLSKDFESAKDGRIVYSAILIKQDDGSYAFIKGEKQC